MTSFNFIKAHRKRDNLSQKELAYLLGFGDNSHVSRIEQGTQEPNLSDLISCEVIFNISASKLFPDVYTLISNTLLQRIDRLQQKLSEEPFTQTNHEKIEKLRAVRKTIAKDNEHRI